MYKNVQSILDLFRENITWKSYVYTTIHPRFLEPT